jgi:hypothetical protein
MPIAEGVQTRVVYKPYASGLISSTAEPVPATEPGASGGKTTRRVSLTGGLTRRNFQSQEQRDDRQVADFRLGMKAAPLTLAGEFSPGTYFDFIEAAHRHTSVASISDSNTELTSVVSDSGSATFTFAGGNPITEGYRVGDIVRFTNLAAVANNSRNFLILGMSGTNGRVWNVFPAPVTDAVADVAFNVTRPGKSTIVPASGHVSRKFAMEAWGADTDTALLYTEGRVAGYSLGVNADGLMEFSASLMMRNSVALSGASAPFFTSPAAATTTGICGPADGLIRLGGATLGVVTGLSIDLEMAIGGDPVVNPLNLMPEIFLGRAVVTGEVSLYFEDLTAYNAFANETEVELLAQLNASSAIAGDSVAVHVPRLKYTAANSDIQGEGGQMITLPFQALRYLGTAQGVESTTIKIHDTAAV